ncbi:PGAP1-like alpha/beta domain-containing protein [Hydrogenophaga soli]
MKPSDLRAAVQLASAATQGVVNITEGVHHAVHRSMGLPTAPGRTTGLTGLVYRSIRNTSLLVGLGLDRVLQALLPPDATAQPDGSERQQVIAILNGVLGDHLAATHNPLALDMTVQGPGGLALPVANPSPHLLVLIHGLCMNDHQWLRHGHDHGAVLAQALGCTPLYLRYNTGLHVADNGQRLSEVLQDLVAHWPMPVQSLRIVAHSMGGLVARSACQVAEQAGAAWLPHLSHLVCLGTPHHGSPLEQAGAWVDTFLAQAPGLSRFTAPFAALGRVRSAGITDLRHGRVTASGQQVPLPPGVACFAVAATLAPQRGLLADRLVGDGLVPLRSALGQHTDPRRMLAFGAGHQRVFHKLGHLGLLSSPAVAQQLRTWLATPPTARA